MPKTPTQRPIETYAHPDKQRVNNPPVGLATPATDPDLGAQHTYTYDPHLDPQLQWAGKTEHTSFAVPTVSLHVHERIDPRTIIEAVRRLPSPDRRGAGGEVGEVQLSLFQTPAENPPLREAVEFYRHAHGWSNRLVAGDSLLVMNSLLEKEGLAGKVQMIYLDPPYGIKYGSNFQPFVNKRDVKDGKDEDLTAEPEQIRAFRDTWELGIHSYLTYLRDRLLLARELLTESGSIFVQISDENVHHVRELMDEVFGAENFCRILIFSKTSGQTDKLVASTTDFLLWYAKSKGLARFRMLFKIKEGGLIGSGNYRFVELRDGSRRPMTREELTNPYLIPEGSRIYRLSGTSSQTRGTKEPEPFEFEGKLYRPESTRSWSTTPEGLARLASAKRLVGIGNTLTYVRYLDDFPVQPITDYWEDTGISGFGDKKIYVVQTIASAIQRCLLMTTDPGDLVLDPTCGSGTTAYVAEQWGRRWITCDTSRVALTLARQRLMTAVFDYYQLAHPEQGVGSGFVYQTVPHITLKSIANNEPPGVETLYDKPLPDRTKTRVSGPFTVEAVPAPAVKSVDELLVNSGQGTGASEQTGHQPPPTDHRSLPTDHYPLAPARSGETLRQTEWRDELLRTGIRGKGGQAIRLARLEPLPGCRWLHADGEVISEQGSVASEQGSVASEQGSVASEQGSVASEQTAHRPLPTAHQPLPTAHRIVVSFGPEHAPLEKKQVEGALQEAQTLMPRPALLIFAAFQFDPQAAKDIDETKWPGVTLLKAQMNADLLTDDLKKKRASNESFWLIGQPDVTVISEQWLVDSAGRRLMPYEFGKILSGADSLAKINALDESDLRLYAALAERRDLWPDLTSAASGSLHPGQHRGGPGAPGDTGIHPLPGDRPGIVSRIGDTPALIERLGLHDAGRRNTLIERLRGNRALAQWAAALPLHPPLTTAHYSQVTVHGFDYYNTRTGALESGGADQIAVWLLDTDYDGRSLYPRQVFFPMAGENEGWARLARNLKAEIDADLLEAYRGAVSLPFPAGEHRRIAVKIVDDRGIESLKVLEISA